MCMHINTLYPAIAFMKKSPTLFLHAKALLKQIRQKGNRFTLFNTGFRVQNMLFKRVWKSLKSKMFKTQGFRI